MAILTICCLLAACNRQGGMGADYATAASNDTLATQGDSTANPFPLLEYPPSWYFATADSDTVVASDLPVIAYPNLGIHYRTFESVAREYGGPSFYREMEYRNGETVSGQGYGDVALLDSILKKIPEAHVMLFHWENTTDRDSRQCGYDMDLYFLNDGDSLRVIYGIKFLPGIIASSY